MQIAILQMIGHALLSTNPSDSSDKVVLWHSSGLISQRLGFKSQQRWGIFLIFKNYLCKLPIGNKFQLGKNFNVPDACTPRDIHSQQEAAGKVWFGRRWYYHISTFLHKYSLEHITCCLVRRHRYSFVKFCVMHSEYSVLFYLRVNYLVLSSKWYLIVPLIQTSSKCNY